MLTNVKTDNALDIRPLDPDRIRTEEEQKQWEDVRRVLLDLDGETDAEMKSADQQIQDLLERKCKLIEERKPFFETAAQEARDLGFDVVTDIPGLDHQ